jgi:hypothetical protein
MTTVFEAAHAVEAHMVLNLLQQQGVAGRIEGEYLQGAIGQLPARGLVRVVVDDEDLAAARAIVAAFEAEQPSDATSRAPAQAAPSRWAWFLAGVLLGALAAAAMLRQPVAPGGQVALAPTDAAPTDAMTAGNPSGR